MAPFELASETERRTFADVIAALVKRILGRKRAERGQQKIEGEVLARLKGMVREVEEDAAAKAGNSRPGPAVAPA